MRIKLNERTTQALAEIMQSKGFNTPTHTLNIIVDEYLNNLNHPKKEDNTTYDPHPTKHL